MKYLLIVASLIITACSETNDASSNSAQNKNGLTAANVDLTPKPGTDRWYTKTQLKEGQVIYAQYCSSCHGKNAESIEEWRKVDSNDNYPPPPLNGTAHAWHHPLKILDTVIRDGGEAVGGVMPAWGETLTERQRLDVIAGFQYYWSDEVYNNWLNREKSNR